VPHEALHETQGLPDPYFESPDRRFRLYHADCLDLMPRMPEASFDLIFADPPYFLSNGGITCHAGKMVSVHKGKWDESKGPEADHEFTLAWLRQCRRLLKPNGSIWVSGTAHIIHSVGYAMQRLGFKLLNDITWVKPNPPPNLSCRYFTHATETIIWARRDEKGRHKFNYALMRRLARGKQMKSVWEIPAPAREEKAFGKHPTQKPLALLERILAASTDENDLVLDPFSGSATTGIAAARMNRPFAGIESDEAFLNLGARRFVGVPQADNPYRILSVSAAHLESTPTPRDLSEQLGITERQVHYYRQAAALLGLLSPDATGWKLTQAGRTVCESSDESARTALAQIIRQTPIIRLAQRKVHGLKDSGSRIRALAHVLSRCTALSGATCLRRAQTLLSWLDWADTHEINQKGFLLFDTISPAAEEPDDVAVA
jgi:site-specific DNA-methyltransferase (adenine-specific)